MIRLWFLAFILALSTMPLLWAAEEESGASQEGESEAEEEQRSPVWQHGLSMQKKETIETAESEEENESSESSTSRWQVGLSSQEKESDAEATEETAESATEWQVGLSKRKRTLKSGSAEEEAAKAETESATSSWTPKGDWQRGLSGVSDAESGADSE